MSAFIFIVASEINIHCERITNISLYPNHAVLTAKRSRTHHQSLHEPSWINMSNWHRSSLSSSPFVTHRVVRAIAVCSNKCKCDTREIIESFCFCCCCCCFRNEKMTRCLSPLIVGNLETWRAPHHYSEKDGEREGGTEQRHKNIINNSAECAGMHTNSIRIQLDGFGTTHQFQYFVFLLDCVRVRCDVQWHIQFGMHVDFVSTIKLWKLWWNSIPFARFFVFGACEQRIHNPFATKCWSFE